MNLAIFLLLILSGLSAVIFLIRDYLSFSYKNLTYYLSLILWIILSSLSAIEQFNSPNFEVYFSSQIDENYKGALLNLWINPSSQITFSLLISIFLFFLYSYFIYHKNKPTGFNVFEKIIYLIMAFYMILHGFNAIAEIQKLQLYEFFISIWANISFVIVVILFLLLTYKGLFKKTHQISKAP